MRIAARAAAAYGAELTVGMRTASHYTDGFAPVTSMIGSHHLFTDVHGYGFHQTLGLNTMSLVLGGLSADSLLKGVYSHRRPVPAGATSVTPAIRTELLHEAALRRSLFRREMAEMRPRSVEEWTQLWPFQMRKHGANVDGNRRLFAIHEPYHCNGVLDVAASAPIEWKTHRRLFREAMRPLLQRAKLIPHTSYYFPVFGRAMNTLLVPGLAAARGVRALATRESRARQAPWPSWSSVAKSSAARELRKACPLSDSPLREIFRSTSPDEIDSVVEGWYSLRRLLLLQLAYTSSRWPVYGVVGLDEVPRR